MDEANTNTALEAHEYANMVQVPRSIETITAEVWLFKQQAGVAILEIGRRLIEAKALLSHGEWLPWLQEKVEFSEGTAQRFMRLAREYENPSTVTDLGASKALILLALPASEREEFSEQKHAVNGKEKTVEEMSARELKKVIDERDAALKKAEEAESTAEQLKRAVEEAEERTAIYQADLEEEQKEADIKAVAAANELLALREQLEELQSAPAPAPDKPVVDEQAVKTVVDAARIEAEKNLKAKIEKAEKAKEKAEQAKAEAEQDLSAMKVTQEEAEAIAKKEKESMAEQVQALQKKLAVASSSEMTIFKLHFEQGQASINKMTECIKKMADGGDNEGAGKLKNALAAILTTSLEVLQA